VSAARLGDYLAYAPTVRQAYFTLAGAQYDLLDAQRAEHIKVLGQYFAALKAVATAIDIPLKSGTVSAEGDLDFRGTLGVAKDAPVGFAQIRLRFDIDSDAPQDKLDQLLKLTERYCVVYQTIKNGPKVSVTMQRV